MPGRPLLPPDELPRAPATQPAPPPPPPGPRFPLDILANIAAASTDEYTASDNLRASTASRGMRWAFRPHMYTRIKLHLDNVPDGFEGLIQFFREDALLAANVKNIVVNGRYVDQMGEVRKHPISVRLARQLLHVITKVQHIDFENALWVEDAAFTLELPAPAQFRALEHLELHGPLFTAADASLARLTKDADQLKCLTVELDDDTNVNYEGTELVADYSLPIPKVFLSFIQPSHIRVLKPVLEATGPHITTLYLSYHPDYSGADQFYGGRVPLPLEHLYRLRTLYLTMPFREYIHAEDVDRLWSRTLTSIENCPAAIRQFHVTYYCVNPARDDVDTFVLRTPLNNILRALDRQRKHGPRVTFTVSEQYDANTPSTWARAIARDGMWEPDTLRWVGPFKCWTVDEHGRNARHPDGTLL